MTDFYPRRKNLGRVDDVWIDSDVHLEGSVWTLAMLNETLKDNAYRLDFCRFCMKRDIEKSLYPGHEEDWRSFLDQSEELCNSVYTLQLRVEKVIWGLEEPAKLKTLDGSNPHPGEVWGWEDIVSDLWFAVLRTNHEIEVSYLEDVKHMRSLVGAIQQLHKRVDDLADSLEGWHFEHPQQAA